MKVVSKKQGTVKKKSKAHESKVEFICDIAEFIVELIIEILFD